MSDISLRDRIAVEAMKAIITASLNNVSGICSESAALGSYKMADAMLAERDKACEVKPMDKAEGTL